MRVRSALTLFGDPDNFRLRQTEGVLSQRLRTHQFSVLLLDEFEKAHPSVLDRFLQLIDEGSFINGNSEIISCRSLIIIATTNAGSEMYRRDAFGFSKQELAAEEIDIEVQRELESCFRFEFLNRFDEIVYFQPLDKKDIRRIASKELKLLEECVGLKRKNLTIEFDDSLLNWLVLHGYNPTNGARFLKRTIERSVIPVLAAALLDKMPEFGEVLYLFVEQEQLHVKLHSSRFTHFNRTEKSIDVLNEGLHLKHSKQLPVVVLQARYSG